MNTPSIYQYALSTVREILSQEINNADEPAERLQQFADVFGRVTLTTFTSEGYQDIINSIDVQPASAQAYLVNIIAQITLHLKLDLDTMGQGEQFSKLQVAFADVLGDLESMELFDRKITDRFDHNLIDSGGPLIVYLITSAYRQILSELNLGA